MNYGGGNPGDDGIPGLTTFQEPPVSTVTNVVSDLGIAGNFGLSSTAAGILYTGVYGS